MATVQDPQGTPVVHYNKSGVALIEVVADNTGTQLPHVCGHIVVLADPDTSNELNNKVLLPVDADVGDVVEVHVTSSSPIGAVTVVAPSGESIIWSGGTAFGKARLFRKISSTVWGGTAP